MELMRCDRQKMNLTVPGCSRLWLSAQADRPKEWEGRYACLTCPIGAANSGASMPTTAEASEFLRKICPRCERPAERFIRNEQCVSCYNRAREVRVGKNAKGNPPTLLPGRLHSEIVVRFDATGHGLITRPQVVGLGEVIVSEARLAQNPIAFARPPLRPASPQLHLIQCEIQVHPSAWMRLLVRPDPVTRRRAIGQQLRLGLAA